MLIKIEEKTKTLQEKDVIIQELLTLMTKFKSQISNQDELMKLLSTYSNTSIRH
jgi:Ca2+-binding EF-hand superfamily protein